jgi:hypothetical protein
LLAQVIAFLVALAILVALIASQYNRAYPHIDDVLADLDRKDQEKNAANLGWNE